MDTVAYQAFTERLQANLAADPRVLGLIALGSMAGQSRQPDEWSDHDFFVITQPGMQEAFRQDLTWLPEHTLILMHPRETAHGLKVVYQDGHVLEFAVFDAEELRVTRVTDYRILLDRGALAETLREIVVLPSNQGVDTRRSAALFLALLVVGAGRYARGEAVSAHLFIKHHALMDLLKVLNTVLPAPDKSALDPLDAARRFEHVFPEAGAQLNALLLLPPLECAEALLALAEPHLPDGFGQAVQVVRHYLARVRVHVQAQHRE